MTLGELPALLVPGAIETWSPLTGRPSLVVDLDAGHWGRNGLASSLAELPCVTIGVSADPDIPRDLAAAFDILLTSEDDAPDEWVPAAVPLPRTRPAAWSRRRRRSRWAPPRWSPSCG